MIFLKKLKNIPKYIEFYDSIIEMMISRNRIYRISFICLNKKISSYIYADVRSQTEKI